MRADNGRYETCQPPDLLPDLVLAVAVHHGEEVVRPVRQLPRPVIAVAYDIEIADLPADRGDETIRYVPYRHAVGDIAQAVVVGHHADAADAPVGQHGGNALHDPFGRLPQFACHPVVGTRIQRQPRLGGQHDAPVEFIQALSAAERGSVVYVLRH